jgi:NAD(P)-dependent dehydrogenase (short-subunit alcohol dehydrogenase family)
MSTHSLIIGGTRGIGRELVRIFSGKNHAVSVIGRRAPEEADRKLPNVAFWTVDLLEYDSVARILAEIVSKYGKLNNLVFLQRYKGDGDRWAGELATGLTATKSVIDLLTDQFSHSGGNSIVVVSSIVDQFIAQGQPAGYHVAKAGLYQLVCYYAVVLGRKGIRVNCVSPGTVVKEENREFYMKSEKLHDLFKRAIPLGRMGTAKESADVIAFLCSTKASFVTGQKIIVDGGVSLLSQESLARNLTNL